MNGIPIVEMHLRHMGEVVHHAIAVRQEEVTEMAQQAVRGAIASFDWKEQIREKTEEAIQRAVENKITAFLWSKEGDELISDAVARAMKAAFGA